jgi:Lrp/AsnC family transcriptional regulator, leucine-responsive regulatory protein
MNQASGHGALYAQGGYARDSSCITLDETNEGILHLLAREGRSTMRDIADAVGRSESTVRERVSALEMRGVVMGYQARIDWTLAGLPLLVTIQAYCPPGRSTEVAGQLHRIPHLVQAVVTTGSPNVLASARVRDIHDLRKVLGLFASTALVNVEARITLESLVAERQPLHALKAAPEAQFPLHASVGVQSVHARGIGLHHERMGEELVHARA